LIDTFYLLLEHSSGWNAALLALGSFLLYAFVSNLAALPFVAERIGAIETSRSLIPKTTMGVIVELLRFGFYVGVPFIALNLGWIKLPTMGFGLLDWAEGVRWAIVILLAAWLLLMVIWLPYLRATADVYATPNTNLSFARRLVELIYMQAHWAFYRAAAIGLFTQVIPDSLYWGCAFGFGLICIEAFSNPRIRQHLTRLGEADAVVWNFGQAILNTLAFIVTRNFYLLVLIQFLLELTVPHLRAARVEQRNLIPPPLPRPQRIRE
jgi:hypothetical protein